MVAQVAALNPALVAATVDLGGWDTHEGQPGRLADRMRVLAQGLGAFDAEIAGLPCRCTVLVVSEFGRRLRSNRSLGTDHGRAGVMLAFGTRGFGLGRHFGAWPGLAPDLLDEGWTSASPPTTATWSAAWSPTSPRPCRRPSCGAEAQRRPLQRCQSPKRRHCFSHQPM
ncbi:DUF1501 domain-containing protein [Paeniroseomonas aquatica]|uniref:DUF1501 domain-containing protein n=1 Tax=Paeniroseomonas aquatica TaxID=373043 RepID=UPI0036177EC7